MCLAIPGKIVSSEEQNGIRVGRVEFGGVARDTCLDLVVLQVSNADKFVAERLWCVLRLPNRKGCR
jgi:hydrogenase maturation factor